jgi:type IV secretory pathway VirB6-like protein
MIIAVAIVGMLMIYGKMSRLNFIKSLLSIVIVSSLLTTGGSIYLLELMKSLFIDGPIEYGGYLVNTMASFMYGDNSPIEPPIISMDPGAGSAFGKLWTISTDLATAIWTAGGFFDGGMLLGLVLYAVAVFLLVAQILVLGASLIMVSVTIFVSPLFIPMILFNSTRQMFQNWVSFGLGGAFGLILLLTMTGVIFGFISITFFQVFGMDLSTGDIEGIDDISDMGKIGAMTVFMLISIKLIPKVEIWASSLAGASAAGVTDTAMAVGKQIAQKTGLATKQAGKAVNNSVVKPSSGAVKRGLGRAVEKLRSKGSNTQTTSSKTDAKQAIAQARLKKAIRERLVNRGQQQNRPLSTLSQKEQSIQKRQVMAQRAGGNNEQGQMNNPQETNKARSSTPVQSREKQSKKEDKNTRESQEKGSSQESKESNPKSVERPVVKNDAGKNNSQATETRTEKTSQTTGSKGDSVAGSTQSSTSTTKTTPSQRTGGTSSGASSGSTNTIEKQKEKTVDRDARMKEKGKKEKYRQQHASMQEERETKRRETNTQNNKKKKGEDEK